MKTVPVVGRDWKVRALLRAELREQSYEALGCETLADARAQLDACSPPPVALVFDTSDAPEAEIKTELPALAERVPVLVIAGAQEQFDDPRFTVFRRPVRLGDVVAAVNAGGERRD